VARKILRKEEYALNHRESIIFILSDGPERSQFRIAPQRRCWNGP
jgi:hypothetical protein